MKSILFSFAFLISTSSFAFVQKSNYKTQTKTYKNGSLIEATKFISTVVYVDGPCQDLGERNELSCLRSAEELGFPKYQITKGNKVFKMHGNYFETSKRTYNRCFACY